MATIVDILKSSSRLYQHVGQDPRMIKVATSDKQQLIAHLRSVRLLRTEDADRDNPFAEPTELCGMTIRYVDQMKPGQVAFADKDGNVIGFVELSMDDEPPNDILRKPWE